MRNLIGQPVRHRTFGKGIVSDLSDGKIIVSFREEEKKFIYPDAFFRYLIFQDHELQDEMEEASQKHREAAALRRRAAEDEARQVRRTRSMKIGRKSQAAFHCGSAEVASILDAGFIETGSYFNGRQKGEPRVPAGLQPNTVVLLTALPEGGEENGRRIEALAMVNPYFWGDECRNGKVKLHDKYVLRLPEGKRPELWPFFEESDRPKRWGRIPFRYIPPETMQEIVTQLCRGLTGNSQAGRAEAFYSYFLKINRLWDERRPLSEESGGTEQS